jgi:hypothetical protein
MAFVSSCGAERCKVVWRFLQVARTITRAHKTIKSSRRRRIMIHQGRKIYGTGRQQVLAIINHPEERERSFSWW